MLKQFALLLLLLLAGCWSEQLPQTSQLVPNGNPQRGRELVVDYGCQTCHAIPTVGGAPSYVGPPLEHWPQRNYIAGQFVNSPINLVAWLQNPQQMSPGTAMPNLGVTQQDARDMAAFLYEMDGDALEWLDRDLPYEEQQNR